MKNLKLLILIFVISIIFTACSDDKTDTKPDNINSGITETSGIPEPTAVPNNLGHLPDLDFGGYNFRIRMGYRGLDAAIYVTEEDGVLVNDAVYRRNKKVEEKFNINIVPVVVEEPDRSNPNARATILAGDDAFDIMQIQDRGIVQDNLCIDWIENMPYVDFDKPWWPEDEIRSMRIGGKLYFAIGEISQANTMEAKCMFFNKGLFKDLNIEYPYADVLSGTWTLDKFISIAKQGKADLNGDGVMTHEDDRWGVESFEPQSYSSAVFYCGGDKAITVHDDGRLELTAYNERTVNIFDKFFDMVDSGAMCAFDSSATWDDLLRSAFRDGRALFYTTMLSDIERHRDSEIDFGILPFPKYDESTPKYYADSFSAVQTYGIPITISDTKRTSAIVEALCAEGYSMVKPVYFEESLKRKYSRDAESEDMLDYIKDGIVFEFAQYFSWIGGNFNWIGPGLYLANNRNFTSFYERNAKSVQRNIDKLNAEMGF